MEDALKRGYERVLAAAAARSLTDGSGLTPREHEARLAESEALAGVDHRRIREVVERCLYGGSRADREEGMRLLRGLERVVRSVPLPERAPRRARSAFSMFRTRLPRILLRAALLLLAAGILSAILIPGSSPPSAGASARRGGSVRGITDWASDEERAAVLSARSTTWTRPASRPTILLHHVSPVLTARDDPASGRGGYGFDTSTGVDHNIRNWADPIHPPGGAHHRIQVYSTIDASFRFGRPSGPHRSALGTPGSPGTRVLATVRVRLHAGKPVPVPSWTPGALVTDHATDPPGIPLEVRKGPADGITVTSSRSTDCRLGYEMVSPDASYHWAPFPDVPLAGLELEPMELPANVRASAEEVLRAIGPPPEPTYGQTVRRLNAYFSGFVVAPIESAERRQNDYLSVALARKGVCRHRAQAFVITANAAGIPARLVTNEVHAYAEVGLPDGRWRLVELRILDDAESSAAGGPSTSAPNWPVLLRILAVVGFGLLVLAPFLLRSIWAEEHRLGTGAANGREALRGERDGREARALRRLVSVLRERIAELTGRDPEDPDALRSIGVNCYAIVRSRALLAETDGLKDRYELSAIYWDAKAILWEMRRGGSVDGNETR